MDGSLHAATIFRWLENMSQDEKNENTHTVSTRNEKQRARMNEEFVMPAVYIYTLMVAHSTSSVNMMRGRRSEEK